MKRAPAAIFLVLFLSMGVLPAGEPASVTSIESAAAKSSEASSMVTTAPAKNAEAGAKLSRIEKIKKFLNPSQTCPHCHQEFSANRSLWMLLVGFVGQIFFTSRFLVQWIASERRKESYIPHVFWHLSILGSVLLLAYAISIKAWPIILGQAFGVTVYGRNLALIARKKNRDAAEAAEQKPEDTSER